MHEEALEVAWVRKSCCLAALICYLCDVSPAARNEGKITIRNSLPTSNDDSFPRLAMIPPDTPMMHAGPFFPDRPRAQKMREAAEAVRYAMQICADQYRHQRRPYVPGFVRDPAATYAKRFIQ